MKRLLLAITLGVLAQTSRAQEVIPPNIYDMFCRNYESGTKERDRCEGRLRASRGIATCQDIEWAYSCRVDEMSDAKTCSASAEGSDLFVFAQKGRISFGVVGDTFPGRPEKIRIDENKAISFDDDYGPDVASNASIERQLRTGKQVRTRYIKWPAEVSDDSVVPVCNLPEVMDKMKAETRR